MRLVLSFGCDATALACSPVVTIDCCVLAACPRSFVRRGNKTQPTTQEELFLGVRCEVVCVRVPDLLDLQVGMFMCVRRVTEDRLFVAGDGGGVYYDRGEPAANGR